MRKENQLQSCCKNSLSSREVVARDLPHPTPLSLLNRKQQPYFMREAEDPGTLRAAKLSGMTPNFMGFTLIELLVVVLIIGILAAIALPQYKKAVEKARMTEAIMAVESIAKANDMYKMANGSYTRDINDLDIEYNAEDYDYSGISAKQTQYFMLAASNAVGDQSQKAVIQRIPEGTKYALIIYFDGTKQCYLYENSSAYEQQLCNAWSNGTAGQ